MLSTGRNGRVALGGYPPRAPTDPYLHALEHTAPQVMGSLLDVAVDDLRPGKRITLQQPGESRPQHHATTITAIQPLSPCARNRPKKPVQCSRIARDSIVRIMAAHLLDQFRVLFDDRMMSVRPTPLGDAPHRAAQSLRGRLAYHRPAAPSGSAPVMSEAQQVERARPSIVVALRVVRLARRTAEGNQPGFVGVNR